MAGVTLNSVKKRFGAVEVIHGVDLTVDDGEFVVFVVLRAVGSQRFCA